MAALQWMDAICDSSKPIMCNGNIGFVEVVVLAACDMQAYCQILVVPAVDRNASLIAVFADGSPVVYVGLQGWW